jgi:hypothetical protein
MTKILAYDPGNKETAWVLFSHEGQEILNCGYVPNDEAYSPIKLINSNTDRIAIEMVACYGMAVGAEVFETAVMVGKIAREAERSGFEPVFIKRMECKMNICHNSRAKDTNIRQALIDRFGAQGTKKNPGPLYGITGDKLAALAVAVTFSDSIKRC